MKAYIFEAPWPTGPKTNFFERSDLYLLGKLKKIGFAALFRVLWIGQSTIKLYHKKQIDSERLAQAVSYQMIMSVMFTLLMIQLTVDLLFLPLP